MKKKAGKSSGRMSVKEGEAEGNPYEKMEKKEHKSHKRREQKMKNKMC